MKYIRFFNEISLKDIALVGGKNASLGEMIQALMPQGITIPYGFAITVEGYWHFMRTNHLEDTIAALTKKFHEQHDSLYTDELKKIVSESPLPHDLRNEIAKAYKQLSQHYKQHACDVAVRSSATAEDLPDASFAGQQDTFLYIRGLDDLESAIKKSIASLFNERAMVYRKEQGFGDVSVALSVGVQKMVQSDKASSGVMFTLDPETGFKDLIIIEAGYGLGELVVQGEITPQSYYVHKPTLHQGKYPIVKKSWGDQKKKLVHARHGLTQKAISLKERNRFVLDDDDIIALASAALVIENYYSERASTWTPMDIEWAKDGDDGKLYIVQARPETVHRGVATHSIMHYALEKREKTVLVGHSIGNKIVTGTARVIHELHKDVVFEKGDILITHMTDPDWVPLVKRAAGMITNVGGRTCHAAIVSRELKIPAIIGTEHATTVLKDGDVITLDCSQGSQGFVYQGKAEFTTHTVSLEHVPQLASALMVNIGDPDQAITVAQLPVDGVGLARLEFIISTYLKVHPLAIAKYDTLPQKVQRMIKPLMRGYSDPKTFFIETLAQAISLIVAPFYPRPVIVRLTDFKSNEYRGLIGGELFEPLEENPMLGFRGASRYRDKNYAPAFELECAAIKRVYDVMGLKNLKIMVPFVRTVAEAQQTIELLELHGLSRKDGLEIYMMVEIPSNIILFDEFCTYFDGFSIGSNDLTQLTLGVDRDSGLLTKQFDERDPAIKKLLYEAIQKARALGKPIGICGQAPSDYPEFADFVMKEGITSISLTPDAIIPFLLRES